eukprot:Hpha_TRINITY_DN816_c0_g1::TRINITY_DN816_c0_g1_i1::g.195042::m.195042
MVLRCTPVLFKGRGQGLSLARSAHPDKGPVQYKRQTFGIYDSVAKAPGSFPFTRGFRLWKKMLNEFPRYKAWDRPAPPVHLQKFHEPGYSWGRVRYRYLVVGEEEWPKVELRSEDMLMKPIDEWRAEHRPQLEGHLWRLRMGLHFKAPLTLPNVERHFYAHRQMLEVSAKAKTAGTTHPPPSTLLDYSL